MWLIVATRRCGPNMRIANGRAFRRYAAPGRCKKRLSMKGRMTTGTELSRRISFTAAAMLAVMMFLLISAGQSKAARSPSTSTSIPARSSSEPSGDLRIEDLGTKASIDGTIDDDGTVDVPTASISRNSASPTRFSEGFGKDLDGPATGTFDATTGQLDIDGTGGIYVWT